LISKHPVSSPEEELILVDSSDKSIGYLSKLEAHQGTGTLHRAFSVFLFNKKGQLLLQQRSREKLLWPLFWANSCCSHPRSGESPEKAVHRRLREELGVSSRVSFLFKFEYKAAFKDIGTEHELCWVWAGKIEEKNLSFNPSEIEAIRFVFPEELDSELARNGDQYTPWIKIEWQRIKEEYMSSIKDILV